MMLNRILPVVVLIAFASTVAAQNINITNVTPAPNVANIPLNANISVVFDQVIINGTVQGSNVVVRGSFTGVIPGVLSGGGTNTITFNPTNNFKPGEVISVTITKNLLGQSSSQGLLRGHTYSFTALVGAAESSPVAFGTRNITFNNSLAPMDVKAMDIENDGDMDLIFGDAKVFGDELSIGINDGTGKFCIAIVGETRIAEMNDLDGDGDKDIASSRSGSGVAWTRNDGGGVFTQVNIAGGGSAVVESLRSGDIDSDGDVDIAVQTIGTGEGIRWYQNNGTGTFAAQGIKTANTGSYSYTQIADVNTDGAMDIVAFSKNITTLAWFENNGTLVFTEHVIDGAMSDYLELTHADIDDDGDLDILTSNENNGIKIRLFTNDGNENFTVQDLPTLTNANEGKLRVVDIDGDLDRDVIASGQWLENNGSEVFTPHKLGSALQQSESVDYVDMDGDGDLDLVTGGSTLVNPMLWFENTKIMRVTATNPANGSHNFSTNSDITIAFDQPVNPATVTTNSVFVKSKFRGVVPGVLSVSGNTITFNPTTDLAPSDDISVAVTSLVRSTTGHTLEKNHGFDFMPAVSVASAAITFGNLPPPIHTYTSAPLGMEVADMDNDGDLDVVSCSATELHWHRNDGTGNFTPVLLTTTVANMPISVTDYNRDGRMDIVTRPTASGPAVILLNDATQTFTSTISVQFLTTPISGFADIDRDGQDDNLAVRYYHRNCDVFSEVARVGAAASAIRWSPGDLDNDGDIDLLRASTGEFHRHDGGNAFSFTNVGGGVAVTRADFDGDGDLDPIYAGTSTASFWYPNNLTTASDNFAAGRSIPSIGESRSLVTADFDGDGDLDIAGAGQRYGLTIMRNRLNEATANFTLSQTMIVPANNPNIVKGGDMNGDGRIDLVAVSAVDFKVSWFPNNGAAVLPPTITNLNPGSGYHGSSVFINGTNFSLSPPGNVVRFNGTLATVNSATANQLRVSVPAGATTGFVTVTIGSNTATSPAQFVVTPRINDFQPNQGPVGTEVILTGTSFGATPADNRVYFDGTEAVVTAASTTSITTIVPPGASSGYIEVHTSQGIASTDDSPFTVTGSGSGITVDVQPVSTTVCSGEIANFWVETSSATQVFYEWQYSSTASGSFINILDGPAYSGIDGNEFSVNTTGGFGAGFYRVVMTDNDGNGMVISDEVELVIGACNPPVIEPQPLSTKVGGIVTIDLIPLITSSNLDVSSLSVVTQPASGALATIDSEGILTIDYSGLLFTGSETVEIVACDTSGQCAAELFNIDVVSDVVVYNAVSPEGKNPILRFQFIEVLPDTRENKVVIFNRWGDVVFEVSNYNNTTNVFAGVSSKGNKLPSGTYYYKVTFNGGRPGMTGYLELRY